MQVVEVPDGPVAPQVLAPVPLPLLSMVSQPCCCTVSAAACLGFSRGTAAHVRTGLAAHTRSKARSTCMVHGQNATKVGQHGTILPHAPAAAAAVCCGGWNSWLRHKTSRAPAQLPFWALAGVLTCATWRSVRLEWAHNKQPGIPGGGGALSPPVGTQQGIRSGWEWVAGCCGSHLRRFSSAWMFPDAMCQLSAGDMLCAAGCCRQRAMGQVMSKHPSEQHHEAIHTRTAPSPSHLVCRAEHQHGKASSRLALHSTCPSAAATTS
jgi:hypothetical protein